MQNEILIKHIKKSGLDTNNRYKITTHDQGCKKLIVTDI